MPPPTAKNPSSFTEFTVWLERFTEIPVLDNATPDFKSEFTRSILEPLVNRLMPLNAVRCAVALISALRSFNS